MRIGELARKTGTSASALRYYEQVGLLPQPERTRSGYRSYRQDAVERVGFIRAANVVGLTLAEVRQVISLRDAGGQPCGVVADLLERRHAEVKARIAELGQLERELRFLRRRAASLKPSDCKPADVCHVIPR